MCFSHWPFRHNLSYAFCAPEASIQLVDQVFIQLIVRRNLHNNMSWNCIRRSFVHNSMKEDFLLHAIYLSDHIRQLTLREAEPHYLIPFEADSWFCPVIPAPWPQIRIVRGYSPSFRHRKNPRNRHRSWFGQKGMFSYPSSLAKDEIWLSRVPKSGVPWFSTNIAFAPPKNMFW